MFSKIICIYYIGCPKNFKQKISKGIQNTNTKSFLNSTQTFLSTTYLDTILKGIKLIENSTNNNNKASDNNIIRCGCSHVAQDHEHILEDDIFMRSLADLTSGNINVIDRSDTVSLLDYPDPDPEMNILQ